MCFEVPALVPPGGVANGNKAGSNDDDANDDDLGIMDIDDNDGKTGILFQNSPHSLQSIQNFLFVYPCLSNFVGKNSAELAALNESLHELLDGIQVMLALFNIFWALNSISTDYFCYVLKKGLRIIQFRRHLQNLHI